MSSTDVGWLWIVKDDGTACEILNDNRTRHYQALHPLWAGESCVECECSVLDYNPDTAELINYLDSPADGATPWFDSNAPASQEFLGWLVNTVDGFDYGHYGRTINQRARTGSNLSPMRASGREITYTIIGTALTERGMVYGMNWLAANLLSIGGRCGSGRILVRPWCDDEQLPGSIDGGMFELRDVALTQAPTWTENFLAENGCLVREARFTLIAGDPCFYGAVTDVCSYDNLFFARTPYNAICDGVTVRELVCGPLPVGIPGIAPPVMCCVIPNESTIDSRAATVTIRANSRTGPFTIETYSQPVGNPCNDAVGNLDFFVGRVAIGHLNGGESAMIDGASGQVFFKPNDAAPWEPDDSLLLFARAEFPVFPRLAGCNDLIVALRAGAACTSVGGFNASVTSVTISSCTDSLTPCDTC